MLSCSTLIAGSIIDAAIARCARLGFSRPSADEARQPRRRLAPKNDVLGDAEFGKEAQLLVDEHDAAGARLGGSGQIERSRSPIEIAPP